MSTPSACTTGIGLPLEPVSTNGGTPKVDRVHEVVDHALVGILPAGNDLEDQIDVAGSCAGQGLEHPCRVDDAVAVVFRGERPVVVGDAVRLLHLDLDEAAGESLPPGLRMA